MSGDPRRDAAGDAAHQPAPGGPSAAFPDAPPGGPPAALPAERVTGLLRKSRAVGRWKRIAALVSGTLLVVLGVIGLFVPVLQGVLFLALGMVLLAPVFPPARRAMVWAFRRWPRLRRAVPRRLRRRAQVTEDSDEEVPLP